jgi:hypothetical protein
MIDNDGGRLGVKVERVFEDKLGNLIKQPREVDNGHESSEQGSYIAQKGRRPSRGKVGLGQGPDE